MDVSSSRRIIGIRRYPAVAAWIISATGVKKRVITVPSAPNNHLSAGPDCGVLVLAAAAFVVFVGVQVFMLGSYFPPVFKTPMELPPPHTIISLPVQTAVWKKRAAGVLVVVVGVQLFVAGSYLPPVLNSLFPSYPPHMIISLPVETAV